MQEQPTRAPALGRGPVAFVDGLGLWIARDHPADTASTLRSRAGRLRRIAKRLGLEPSALYPRVEHMQRRGVGFFVSPAPLWHRPLDLEARTAGREPRDLLALLSAAERAGARLTRLDVAMDFLGTDAQLARRLAFPSHVAPDVDPGADLLRLRGRTRTRPARCRGTVYERRAKSARVLAVYSDRPSKLAPLDGPALHVELRLRGEHIPSELRAPENVLNLLQPLRIEALFARHARSGTRFASRAR